MVLTESVQIAGGETKSIEIIMKNGFRGNSHASSYRIVFKSAELGVFKPLLFKWAKKIKTGTHHHFSV